MQPTPQSEPSVLSNGPNDAAVTASLAAALGRIPSGLFVVTWLAAGRDRGMLASWVMQAGFDPPLVTVAVGGSRDLLASVDAGAAFVVNVLADSQRALVGRFARPSGEAADPFSDLTVGRTPCGAAALPETAAWLECRPVARADVGTGDHAVVVARVVAASAAAERAPMVHLRRNGLRY